MSDQQLVEQFKLLKRAKKLEEMGSMDRALELYQELHESYHPNTSDAYERPAIILERKKQYQDALDMCQKAIDMINDDKMSGTKSKFEKRIESIQRKMKDQPVIVQEVKESYRINVIGFRSNNKGKMITASIFYLLFAVFGVLMQSPYPTLLLIGILYTVVYFADLLKAKTSKKTITLLLLVAISLTTFASINLPAAVERVIELQDSEGKLEGGDQIFTQEDVELPKILQSHIDDAIKVISSEIEVKEAGVSVVEDTVTFILVLDPTTAQKRAMDLGEDFIEVLAHRVSDDEDLKRPNFNSHGELYEYYSLIISAGSDAENLIAKGKKSKTASYITWID